MGKFTGLVTGKKKDDLKDVAQALCLDLQGKNQELADRIDRHLDKSPHLEKDGRFGGLFAARIKKKSAQKKRKEPTPAVSGGGRDGETSFALMAFVAIKCSFLTIYSFSGVDASPFPLRMQFEAPLGIFWWSSSIPARASTRYSNAVSQSPTIPSIISR